MCLTPSTWKVQNGEARSAVETTPCCPPPIPLNRSRVSERSKSLGCWSVSRSLLLPLSCRLSSFCWVVNHLPYLRLWTRYSVEYCPPSLDLHRARLHHELHVPKRYVNYVYFNRKHVTDIHTPYIHTYIHTYIQAQPQTKTPLAAAAPARLWASRLGVRQ